MKTNEDILKMVFKVCDHTQYEVNQDGTVTIWEQQNHRIQKFFRQLQFNVPQYKKVTMDEYSSAVFLLIDSQKTIEEIGKKLDSMFGERVHPLYERLLLFLNHIEVDCHYIERA